MHLDESGDEAAGEGSCHMRKAASPKSTTPKTASLENEVKRAVRTIKDFPQKGIAFKDLMPILAEPKLFRAVCDHIADVISHSGATALMVPEARGFLFGSCIAYKLGLPLIPARKAGKLPPPVISMMYELEYGSAEINIPANSVHSEMKVCIFDDLLASGGTAGAMARLIEDQGATVVCFAFIFELSKLSGRHAIQKNGNLGSRHAQIKVLSQLD